MVNEHRAVGPDTQHEIVEPDTAMMPTTFPLGSLKE